MLSSMNAEYFVEPKAGISKTPKSCGNIQDDAGRNGRSIDGSIVHLELNAVAQLSVNA